MKCPTCDQETRVVETRGTRRRRECANGHRFTSLEVLLIKGQTVDQLVAEGHKRLDEEAFENRLAMARAPGKLEDVARAYGVSATTVSTWRARLAAIKEHT